MKRLRRTPNIGDEVTILAGPYTGEWGIVKYYDGEYYHVALWNGEDSLLVFEADEIRVSK